MQTAMCPDCRRSDTEVGWAAEEQRPCPHCGSTMRAVIEICCMPDCTKRAARSLPLCEPCGIKVAIAYRNDAVALDPAVIARREQRERERADDRSGQSGKAKVYYLRLTEDRIKIGYSTNLPGRITALRLQPDALLAWEPGGQPVEIARHQQFAADRIVANREDFRPSPALNAWIEWLQRAHGLPRSATLPDTKTVTVRNA